MKPGQTQVRLWWENPPPNRRQLPGTLLPQSRARSRSRSVRRISRIPPSSPPARTRCRSSATLRRRSALRLRTTQLHRRKRRAARGRSTLRRLIPNHAALSRPIASTRSRGRRRAARSSSPPRRRQRVRLARIVPASRAVRDISVRLGSATKRNRRSRRFMRTRRSVKPPLGKSLPVPRGRRSSSRRYWRCSSVLRAWRSRSRRSASAAAQSSPRSRHGCAARGSRPRHSHLPAGGGKCRRGFATASNYWSQSAASSLSSFSGGTFSSEARTRVPVSL